MKIVIQENDYDIIVFIHGVHFSLFRYFRVFVHSFQYNHERRLIPGVTAPAKL